MKPQVAQRYQLRDKAVKLFAEELSECLEWGTTLVAERVIDQVISDFEKSVSPKAPNVVLSDKSVLEQMIAAAQALAEQMDERGEIEQILSNAQS